MKPYKLILDDGGRSDSKRPLQQNDCTVRAFAILSGLDYDTVYETLARAGRPCFDGFDSNGWLKRRGGLAFNGLFKPIKLKTAEYNSLTPDSFAIHFPKGYYLLENDGHTWACIDGKHYDLWRTRKELTGVWKFHPNHYKNRINR